MCRGIRGSPRCRYFRNPEHERCRQNYPLRRSVRLCGRTEGAQKRRLVFRLCARVEPEPPYIERPHGSHRDIAAALSTNGRGGGRADQPLLQIAARRGLQHASRRNGRYARSLYQPTPNPLSLCTLHHGARDGSLARFPRLVPASRHQMARCAPNRECGTASLGEGNCHENDRGAWCAPEQTRPNRPARKPGVVNVRSF